MFSTHPHSSRRTLAARLGAATVAAATVGALSLISAPAASAATLKPASQASANFVGGSVLGLDLDAIVDVAGAQATNSGSQGTQTVRDPFHITALQTVEVGADAGLQLDLGDVVQTGVANQFAQATKNGTSMAATGAITQDGLLGVGSDQTKPLGTTTVDLEALLGSDFADTITGLDLELDAIAAQAKATLTKTSGDYTIAGARLVIDSPAVANLTKRVDKSLDSINKQLKGLGSDDGRIANAVNKVLKKVNPALNVLGSHGDITVTVDVGDLKKLVHKLLTDEFGDSAVSFDLDKGSIIIDLEKLTGSLNDLKPNTELLSDAVVLPVLHEITDTVSNLSDDILDTVKDALHDATVTVKADVDLDVAQAPIVKKVCETVTKVIQVPVEVEERVNLPLVGWVIRTVTKLVDKTVESVVCHNETTKVLPLNTSLDLALTGSVDDYIQGAGVNADLSAKVLGIPAKVNANLAIDGIGDVLGDELFSSDGTVHDLTQALNTNVVDPVVDGLLGDDDALGVALTDVISVKANVQSTATTDSGKQFTETAVQVAVLPGVTGGGAVTLDLAQATVGPNAGVGGDGGDCTSNCGGGDDDCVVNCGVGGDGGDAAGADPGSLAFTGVGIALLLAIVLALVAAGAYLVRVSYRRRQTDLPLV